MKKGIIFIILTAFVVFVSANTIFAYSSNLFKYIPQFGGKITTTVKALEIQELEESGFNCVVPGITIEIIPIGSPAGTPKSYFIPSYIRSKANTTPRAGQWIMGKYFGKTQIQCTFQASTLTVTKTVSLNTIILFTTSK